MQYTRLGSSGAVVSRFALGTMTFGSPATKDEAHRQLDTYVSAGGTLIDTADVYNDGMAEEIIGTWLQCLDGPSAGLSRRHLRRALDASLLRLGVEHIDLYQLRSWAPITPHRGKPRLPPTPSESARSPTAACRTSPAGRSRPAAAHARRRRPLVSVQPQYSLLTREVEWEILPACQAAGLAVLPWSPLGRGWLTGKYRRDARPAKATRLGDNPDADGMEAYDRRAPSPRTWAILDRLDAIAAERRTTPGSVALAWPLAQPLVTSVILGARTTEQLRTNLAAAELLLTDDELRLLDDASDPEPADYHYGLPGVDQRSQVLHERSLAAACGPASTMRGHAQRWPWSSPSSMWMVCAPWPSAGIPGRLGRPSTVLNRTWLPAPVSSMSRVMSR